MSCEIHSEDSEGAWRRSLRRDLIGGQREVKYSAGWKAEGVS